MLRVSVFLLLGIISGVRSSHDPETETKVPEEPLLTGIENIDDNELWDLLKKGGRSGSDPVDDRVYDYGDYVDLEENVVRVSPRDSESPTPSRSFIPSSSHSTGEGYETKLDALPSSTTEFQITDYASIAKYFPTIAENRNHMSKIKPTVIGPLDHSSETKDTSDSQTVNSDDISLGSTASEDQQTKTETSKTDGLFIFSTIGSTIETYGDKKTFSDELVATETTFTNISEINLISETKTPKSSLSTTISTVSSGTESRMPTAISSTTASPSNIELLDKSSSATDEWPSTIPEHSPSGASTKDAEIIAATTGLESFTTEISTLGTADTFPTETTTAILTFFSTSNSEESMSSSVTTQSQNATITLRETETTPMSSVASESSSPTFPEEAQITVLVPTTNKFLKSFMESTSTETTSKPSAEISTPNYTPKSSTKSKTAVPTVITEFPEIQSTQNEVRPTIYSPTTVKSSETPTSTVHFSTSEATEKSTTTKLSSALPTESELENLAKNIISTELTTNLSSKSPKTAMTAFLTSSVIPTHPMTTVNYPKTSVHFTTTPSSTTRTLLPVLSSATDFPEKIGKISKTVTLEVTPTITKLINSSKPSSLDEIFKVTTNIAVPLKTTPEQTKETTPESAKKITSDATKETTPEPTKETTPESTKKTSPESAKKTTPGATKKTTLEPTKKTTPESTKKTTPEARKKTTPEARKKTTSKPSKKTTPKPTKKSTSKPTPINSSGTKTKTPSTTSVTSKIFSTTLASTTLQKSFPKDVTEKSLPRVCTGPKCPTKKTTKISIFDSKKLFMIDEVTSPTIALNKTSSVCCTNKKVSEPNTIKPDTLRKVKFDESKKINIPSNLDDKEIIDITRPTVPIQRKFDPSRMFSITDEKTQPPPSNNPNSFRKTIDPRIRPVINLSMNTTSPNVKQGVVRGSFLGNEQGFRGAGSNIPELICFQVISQDNKARLSCLHANSTLRRNSRPFFVDIRTRNPFTFQNTNGQRRIFFQNRNRYAIVKNHPSLRYHLRGSVHSTHVEDPREVPAPLHFQLGIQSPQNGLHIVSRNRQTFGAVEVPTNENTRGVFVLRSSGQQGEIQPNFGQQRLDFQIISRNKRSVSSYCNPDNDLNEEPGRTLAIVFDNTGSMSSELAQMREVAKEIVFQMSGLKRALIREYVLVTFNDPDVSDPFCTTSFTSLIEKLNKIYVEGGGDCPEMSLTGLTRALTVSRSNSFVFVITDATAKDRHLEGQVMELVMRKTPSIFFLLTGTCSTGVEVYRNISKALNLGDIYNDMDKSGVKEMMKIINEQFVRSDIAPLVKYTNPKPAKVPYKVDIDSDSSVGKLTVSVTGKNPKLKLTSPQGKTNEGEKKTYQSTVMINVEKPVPGKWTADVSSSSAHSVSAIGTSNIKFIVGFSLLPTDKISETSHRPLKGGENYILIEVSNPELIGNITAVEIFSLSGERLARIDVKKLPTANNTLYRGGPFIPPNDYFNMKMHGLDKAGIPIRRISPSAISPQLPELPYITMLTRMTIEAGKPLVIRCHVESLVAINLKLFKKTDTGDINTYHFKQTGDVYLEIKSATPADEGIYTCWAKNIAGEQFKDIRVTVTVKPPLVTVESEIIFKRDYPAEIPCKVISPVKHTVQWMKDARGHFFPLQNSSRIHALDESLIIENPKEAEEGWYQCLAKNAGGESKGLTYLKMSIIPFITISDSRHFRSGFNLTIICSVTGVPSPDIIWQKDGQNFQSEDHLRISMAKDGIYFLNAVKEDQGTYTCIASNLAGTDSKSTDLIYEELPKVKSPQKEVEVLAGEDILLQCEATGVPTPQVHWKKDSVSVSKESISNNTVLSDNSLLIRPSSLIHSGIYTCLAQNDIGGDELTIVVRVEGTVPVIVEPPEDVSIEIGGKGRLSCEANGHPEPRITWRRSPGKSVHATVFDTSLEFINASLSDGGKYWCVAENLLGRRESAAEVHISGGVSPVISKIKDIEVIKVLVGDKVELTCSIIDGKPHPSIMWFKDGLKLSGSPGSGIQLDNGSYFLSAVNPSDTGIYECLAINELGSDSKKAELKLFEPPRIDHKSSSNVVVTVGKSANLICAVTGDPKPNVSWKRYSYGDHKIINGIKFEDSDNLYFGKVTEEDSGRYICRAENIAGFDRRLYALQVMVPPHIVVWPAEKFVEVGNIVTLECKVRAIPRPSVMWLKDNSTVPSSKYFGQFMRFYASANDSGTYSCIAENRAGKDKVETNLIVLVPPQIAEGPSNIKAISGRDAILPCEVSGNPQPSIAWQWNGELIKKGSGSDSGTLHLINVTEADAGIYICTAQNKAGTSKKKIELIILTPPKILPWTEPIKVILDELVNVTCQHFAEPKATIKWYKGRVPFSTEYHNRLEFHTKSFHKGVYTCEAKNEAGIDSKDFSLVILDPPTFAQNQPLSLDVLKGKDLDIPCVAFGDPKPIMGWSRNDEVLISDSKRNINSETGFLTIFSVSPEDEGYYNCSAKNRAGEVWRTIKLNVLELPEAKLEVSNNLVKEGGEVVFTCHVTGKPLPKILWMKDGVLLSTENDKQLRLIAFYKDQGNYTCVVQNSVGENFSSAHLNVSVMPFFHGHLEERLVKLEGEDVLLNCSGEGVPTPDIFWFFNGTQLEKYGLDFKVVNSTLLELAGISRERDGLYTCEAKNFAGSVKKQIRLFVHVKPFIVDQFETQITLIEGKDLSLPCSARGVPTPEVEWMKNDSVIPQSESSNNSALAVYENILLIFNADNNSAGVYTCKAENEEGIARRSYTISVKVPKMLVKPGVEYVDVPESADTILKCDAKPGSEITWLKDNQTLENMPQERADDVHFLVHDGGQSLKITEVFSEDSGMFSCHATHPEGNSSKTFSLDVLVAPYFIEMYPDTEFTIRENKSLILECPLQGNPPPIVNWRLALSNIPVNEYTVPGVYPYGDNGNSLIFRSAKPNHTGLYVCSGTNKLGQESRTYNIKVVGPPKRIGHELTNIDVVSGSQVELNCSVEGSPQPVLKWILSSSGREKVLKYVSKNIRIGYAQTEDDGLYNCSASNSFGNTVKLFNVSVYDVPRIRHEADDNLTLAVGEDLFLNCMSTVRKPLTVKWFFNEEELNSSDHMSITLLPKTEETKFTYFLPNVTKASQGLYKCILSNLAGSDEREFEVEVIAPPMLAIDTTTEKLQINIGSPIDLECPIKSENLFKITWKKNGVIIPELENKTLNIPFTTVDDEGNYTCIGSNIAGMIIMKFEVNILAAPELIASDDDVNIAIPLEESLSLNCTVFGNPKPQILWIKNLKQIDEVLFPQILLLNDNQILKIDEVDSTDGGKYSCFSSNIAGSTEKHFEVQILEPPSVQVKNISHKTLEKIITTDVYKRAVLRCPLSGSPEPEISWSKGTEEIKGNDLRFKISLDKKILLINHADESTAGIFKCTGRNDIGNTSYIFHFHVRIPMQWSQWSKWTECSVPCGGGAQSRSRECLGERNDILSEYIHLINASCTGINTETQGCNEHVCPVDGGWGNWSDWGSCSSSCGNGWKRRTRRCNNPLPANGGLDCPGETFEDEPCESVPCPINGNWGEWSDWSDCSATCGPSIKMRTRRCNNPAPNYGGLPCSGNSRDITLCRKRSCPVEFSGWSSWSRWSPCSTTCGTGTQSRFRTCLLEAHGRQCATGSKRQVRLCKNSTPCRKRYPRHAELKIHGELNNQTIADSVEAEIVDNDNGTSAITFSKQIFGNETFSYLPFAVSPVSWLIAQEEEKAKNGFSLTNGSFHENSTYRFSTGEEMEMQSDAQSSDNQGIFKLDIKLRGNTPPSPAASIVIEPYDEDIIQRDPNRITASSNINLNTDGQNFPVSVRKTLQFSGRRLPRISPVERLISEGSRSNFDKESNLLYYHASPPVISSKMLRNACPKGFKYNLETGECADINECRRRGLNNCLPSQICINTLGSYNCECRQGFRVSPNKFGCKDINECQEGIHSCSHRCINTRGSYQCMCPKSLILAEDMHNCVEDSDDYYTDETDSNEYPMNISYLDAAPSYTSPRRGKALAFEGGRMVNYEQQDQSEMQAVFSSLPSQQLSCQIGFKPGYDGCEDINECTEDDSPCSREQLCMNTPGSFVCIEAPCPDHFFLSQETRSCLLLCTEEEEDVCTDGAILSESLQIIAVPVFKGNYTFHPFTTILEMTSYDNNDLPLRGSIYEIVQNEAGLPVAISTEETLGILLAVKYFEVTKEERLVLMSSKYDVDGSKLHSTMFVVLIYNANKNFL